MFSNSTGLDLSRPRICVTTVFSRSTMEARLTGPSSSNAIARNSVGCRVATNAASFSHGPPALAHQDRLERPPLRVGRALVDDDRLQPAAVDHALRRVERDHRARARERHLAERALVDAHGPVALAAFVRAVLTEMHVARADERARAVLEDQAARVPGGGSGGRHRRIGLVDPRCYIRFPSCRSGLSGRSNHSTSQNLSNLRPTAWKMPTDRNPNFLCSDSDAGFGRLMPATTV